MKARSPCGATAAGASSSRNKGWIAWVLDENALVHWSGGSAPAATSCHPPPLQNLPLIGIGTEANAVNPFATRLNKALWTARTASEGGDGDLRYTLNKQGPANVLSLLLQSDWAGRAEIGLVGDDDRTVRVNPDGMAWTEALRIAPQSGRVALSRSNALTGFAVNLRPDSGRFAGHDAKGIAAGAFALPPTRCSSATAQGPRPP